jgi:hypothetical protein
MQAVFWTGLSIGIAAALIIGLRPISSEVRDAIRLAATG